MSTGKGKREMTSEEEENQEIEKEVNKVQSLIEKCMLRYLNQNEIADLLYEEQKIEPSFTNIVWEELEKNNKKFFENYNSMLITKELNEKQAADFMKNTLTFQSGSSGSNMLPMNFDHGKSSSVVANMFTSRNEEMQMVKNLIEQCLVHFMNQKQVIDILHQKENIDPSLTKTVWQHLEEQNQEFFKNYYLRLVVKHQIIKFNSLLEMQAAMMNQMNPNEIPNLEIDRTRLGNLGLQLQAPTASSALPAANNNRHQSGSGSC